MAPSAVKSKWPPCGHAATPITPRADPLPISPAPRQLGRAHARWLGRGGGCGGAGGDASSRKQTGGGGGGGLMAAAREVGGYEGREKGKKRGCEKMTDVGQGTVATLLSHTHSSLASSESSWVGRASLQFRMARANQRSHRIARLPAIRRRRCISIKLGCRGLDATFLAIACFQ